MKYTVTPAPSFIRDAKPLLRVFKEMAPILKDYLVAMEEHGAKGDLIPRYGNLWKDRIAMPPYRIGKSGGWRIVSLVKEEEKTIIPLFLYYKRDKADITEKEVKAAIRELTS